ncbi:MAG: ATP-binding cassette domain-containing protein [Lachnospiraceae bacterium]|nr:ATP-binding cassette domain-containing protein [Lachnospiraceae bacterium]
MRINAFTKTYGSRRVLDFPGCELERGKICAVIGANGSGKSTFASILAGTVTADGKVETLSSKISCGFMPQKSYAFRMSVLRNILLNGNDLKKAERVLNELSLMELKNAGGKTLSGGETAKMALARLLVRHYDLLILDEPCASMDMKGTIAAERLITEYAQKENAAVILVTHSLAQAKRMASCILFFDDGKLNDDPERMEEFLRFYGSDKGDPGNGGI